MCARAQEDKTGPAGAPGDTKPMSQRTSDNPPATRCRVLLLADAGAIASGPGTLIKEAERSIPEKSCDKSCKGQQPRRQAPGERALPGMGLREVVCVGVDEVDGEEPGPCRACRALRENILVNARQRQGPTPLPTTPSA